LVKRAGITDVNPFRRARVCIRRYLRKRVLFATQKTGRGGQKKAEWNKDSIIKC
jgi:hypothetical protein